MGRISKVVGIIEKSQFVCQTNNTLSDHILKEQLGLPNSQYLTLSVNPCIHLLKQMCLPKKKYTSDDRYEKQIWLANVKYL